MCSLGGDYGKVIWSALTFDKVLYGTFEFPAHDAAHIQQGKHLHVEVIYSCVCVHFRHHLIVMAAIMKMAQADKQFFTFSQIENA